MKYMTKSSRRSVLWTARRNQSPLQVR